MFKKTNTSILVVGANGGLAKETIKHLIKDGYNDIIMGVRTKIKGEKAKQEIVLETKANSSNITIMGGFDMNKPNDIEKAIQNIDKKIATVFLAAGNPVMSKGFETVQWNGKQIEKNVFQNMIGSHVTLLKLKKHGKLAEKTRVIMSGGEGARGLPGMITKPFFSSPQALRDYVFAKSNLKYNPMNALGASKYFGALWTIKISTLIGNDMDVVWLSPGLTHGTEGLKNFSLVKRWFMENIVFGITSLFGLSQSPSKGGRKFADAIVGKIGQNGDLLGAPYGKAIGKIVDQTTMNKDFSNQELIDEFWNILTQEFGAFNS